MYPELLEHLRNFDWIRRTYTKLLNALRNCQWFCTKDTKLRKFSTRCTVLLEGFIVKSRNSLQFSKPKKVLYENYETIFVPRNLKSFRKTVPNLQSSVEY